MVAVFLMFAHNIDCGYTLEPPRRCGSNEYPQSMFWSKNMKYRYTPAYPSFAIKRSVLGGTHSGTYFPDVISFLVFFCVFHLSMSQTLVDVFVTCVYKSTDAP